MSSSGAKGLKGFVAYYMLRESHVPFTEVSDTFMQVLTGLTAT